METILNYLDNIFMHCQQTPEVQRAKEDLAEMMEDKYNELTAQGKAKHEAIGIVISEFGNIQELAEELELKVSKSDSEPDEKRNSFDIPDKSEIQNEDTVKNKSDTEYNSFRSSKDTGIHLTEIDGAEYLFALTFGMGALGIWYAMLCDWGFRAIVFSLRWICGGWKNKSII